MSQSNKFQIHSTIRQKIYWTFSLLVFIFVANAVVTVFVLNQNKKRYHHIATITSPSIKALHDLRQLMSESIMFTTDWVFVLSDNDDKKSLIELQHSTYPVLKSQLATLAADWKDKPIADSLDMVLARFESVINNEIAIVRLLETDEHYNDPARKSEAERKLEHMIIPETGKLSVSLDKIIEQGDKIKSREEANVEKASRFLRALIFMLAIGIVSLGIFFSFYMARKIVTPILRIRDIINDLGKGKIRNIDFSANGDEVGTMILSVNNLSEKLKATATFAKETGLRNFDMPFMPLSEEDTLGEALLAMRENLKLGETNLAIKNKELETKNKELEEFAFVASHDLQEPLRTTSSYVDLFQRQYRGKLDEKADKYLTYISQASDRMQVLITDLLEYSRIGTKKELRPVNCNTLLTEVFADLDTAIKETATEIAAGELPVINGYGTEIKLLFQNLIANSIKFRKKDGPAQITIAAWEHRENWQFAFADNGIGIAKEHFDRIFNLFQRLHTRSQYAGSGIGLSHCKKIVELHKGKMWLESELNRGTTFYFTIPQNIS